MFAYYLNGVTHSEKTPDSFEDCNISDCTYDGNDDDHEIINILNSAEEELEDEENHGREFYSIPLSFSPDEVAIDIKPDEIVDKALEKTEEEYTKYTSVCYRLRSFFLGFLLCQKTEVRDFVVIEVNVDVPNSSQISETKEE